MQREQRRCATHRRVGKEASQLRAYIGEVTTLWVRVRFLVVP